MRDNATETSSKDGQLFGLQDCQEQAQAPIPDFSVNKLKKIRLSAMAITRNEVSVYGVAATVGDYF